MVGRPSIRSCETKKKLSTTDKLVRLQLYYRDNPIEFIKQIFNAEPTEQQIELIEAATKPHARVAVKSATSTGKTTCLAWLTFYFLLCYPDCRGLVTAPTASQLFRVFRSELNKWHGKMLPVFAEMFEVMAEMIFVKGKKGTQFFSWVTGSPENKESFAGLHATKVVLFVDEASALPGEIFDTLYGTLSSGDTSFVLVSNPVRAEGAFYKLFQIPDYESKWKRITFTSFGSPNVDKDWIEEMRAYYGEDHDFWKMRVMGEFPIMSEAQYIPTDAVEGAMARVISPQEYLNYPRVMGVDVARFGDDCSIIVDRQGPKILDIKHFKGLDTIQFAEQVMSYYTQNLRAFSCVAVDGIGVGAGVVDQLRRYDGIPLMEVQTSVQAPDFKTYANTRAQLWGEMKSWLVTADIPKDDELREQLVSINYGYNSKMQVLLESKKDMKRRGKTSPDKADAIALTFAPSIFSFVQAKKRPKVIRQTKYRWV